jgi:hypothetical protein
MMPASDEGAISPKAGSPYRPKLRRRNMLQLTKVTLELRILSGYRCEEGASGPKDNASPSQDSA